MKFRPSKQLLKIDDWSLPRCTSTKAKEVGSARGTRRRDKMAKDATLLSGSLRTGALFGKTATPTNLTLQNLNTESPEVQLKPMPPPHTHPTHFTETLLTLLRTFVDDRATSQVAGSASLARTCRTATQEL